MGAWALVGLAAVRRSPHGGAGPLERESRGHISSGGGLRRRVHGRGPSLGTLALSAVWPSVSGRRSRLGRIPVVRILGAPVC